VSPSTHPSEFAVAGGALAALEFGDDAELPVVIAAHGITANAQSWRVLARALDGHARVLAPDLRGRGASNSLPGPCGMAAHAADLLTIIDALSLERAVLVGHSMGAYAVARLAADHPDRVHAAILVDGGLTVSGIPQDVDPQVFIEAFLGPALARLKMTFATREAYYDWWRAHPAFQRGDVEDADLVAYAERDLTGSEPELRSAVSAPAVRDDAGELFTMGDPAHELAVPAVLLCAPRGLQDQPEPMQPVALVNAWVAEDPTRRQMLEVPGVNHYTITLGSAGAQTVAGAVRAALRTSP
jgi:pimeloyl-ACP methyl ester carboxylesterase